MSPTLTFRLSSTFFSRSTWFLAGLPVPESTCIRLIFCVAKSSDGDHVESAPTGCARGYAAGTRACMLNTRRPSACLTPFISWTVLTRVSVEVVGPQLDVHRVVGGITGAHILRNDHICANDHPNGKYAHDDGNDHQYRARQAADQIMKYFAPTRAHHGLLSLRLVSGAVFCQAQLRRSCRWLLRSKATRSRAFGRLPGAAPPIPPGPPGRPGCRRWTARRGPVRSRRRIGRGPSW